MNNTDQLRQLMTLDADINTPEIELRFEQIAKMLFDSIFAKGRNDDFRKMWNVW